MLQFYFIDLMNYEELKKIRLLWNTIFKTMTNITKMVGSTILFYISVYSILVLFVLQFTLVNNIVSGRIINHNNIKRDGKTSS